MFAPRSAASLRSRPIFFSAAQLCGSSASFVSTQQSDRLGHWMPLKNNRRVKLRKARALIVSSRLEWMRLACDRGRTQGPLRKGYLADSYRDLPSMIYAESTGRRTMDIAGIWRNMLRNPNEAPPVGAHL